MKDKFISTEQRTILHNDEHPYKQYVDSSLWKVIDGAIEDLINNQDIEETTNRRYIVGYLCKKISELNSSE